MDYDKLSTSNYPNTQYQTIVAIQNNVGHTAIFPTLTL